MIFAKQVIDGCVGIASLLKMVTAHLQRGLIRVAPHDSSSHAQLDKRFASRYRLPPNRELRGGTVRQFILR
jgi:hypothetical protein